MVSAKQDDAIRQIASTRMPTRWGTFQTLAFERYTLGEKKDVETALAMIMGDVNGGVPLLRIHSQCLTSEVFGSLRCDCSDQLEMGMRAIAGEGRGIVIYEHQEGRGIGLMAKIEAYSLQDAGLDTVEANEALGLMADCRTFGLPADILHHLGITRVRLLSNNPAKCRALVDAGIEVVQIPCEVSPNEHSVTYLRSKKVRMGHTLCLGRRESAECPARDQFHFADVETALDELRAGRMIVVIDDEDRENEGDLVMAAEHITPEAINFMATQARGLICLSMTGERLDELELGEMARDNTALGGTAFTVSIDLKGHGVTTGISAYDRAQTIRAAVDPGSAPDDFGRPGHIFPLRARNGGVLERRGQTEASVDLARLAGLYPAGVICEILNDDGTMSRLPDLIRFCRIHKLALITVADLARYRLDTDDEESLALMGSLLCA